MFALALRRSPSSAHVFALQNSRGRYSIMWRGVLAGAASIFVTLHAPLTAERPQFEVLRLNGELVRWFPRNGGKIVVTYALADRDVITPQAINCGTMRAPARVIASARIDTVRFRAIMKDAFETWAQVANVSFVETVNADEADVLIGEQAQPIGWAFSNLIPGPARANGFRQISKGAICFNPQRPWKDGFNGDKSVYDLNFTLTHEIGHILGLDHPSRRGQLMSFRYDEAVSGLTPGDIAGAAFMYGARDNRPIPASVGR
jgi:hypothetical protein